MAHALAAGERAFGVPRRDRVSFQGSVIECRVDLGDGVRLRAVAHPSTDLVEGRPVWLRVDGARCTVFRTS